MGKLVRDRIPDIIRASGRTPLVTTLGIVDYHAALRQELQEEVAELVAAHGGEILEEAADVLEVLAAIAAEHAGTTSSCCRTPKSPMTSRFPSARAGRSFRLSLAGGHNNHPWPTPRSSNPPD